MYVTTFSFVLSVVSKLLLLVCASNSSDELDEVNSGSVFGKWDSVIHNLRNDLLKDYDKYNPPVDTKNKNVTEITVYLFMRFLNDFNEVSGHLESTVMIQTWWKDSRLSWDPPRYNGFKGITGSLIFDFKEIWVPHIILWNPVNSFEILDPSNDYLLARAYPSGDVFFMIGGKITTHCVPYVKYFPFDKHECYVELITYESLYFPGQIKVSSKNVGNLFGFDENPQWIVSVGDPKNDNFLGVGIDVVKFPITLERRALFLLFNLFAPILLLSLINVCVFAIPVQSGERSSFAITVFLALAVYMTVVADSIPHSSNPMPLWSYFLLFKLVYSACIALCSTIIMRIANKQTPLPLWISKIMVLGKKDLQFDSTKKLTKIRVKCEVKKRDSFINGNMYDEHEILQVEDSKGKPNSSEISWKDAANFLDKIFLAIFLVIAFLEIICTLIFTYTKV